MNTVFGLSKVLFNHPLVINAEEYACEAHNKVNHSYDGNPYSYHLGKTFLFAIKYIHLIPENERPFVLAAIWLHDTIEDCRKTYNDIKQEFGEEVAELVFAVTNEKGRTRKDRANDVYYQGIKDILYATFVKLCDRLANVQHSKDRKSNMLQAYRKENAVFKEKLWNEQYKEMFDETDELLK